MRACFQPRFHININHRATLYQLLTLHLRNSKSSWSFSYSSLLPWLLFTSLYSSPPCSHEPRDADGLHQAGYDRGNRCMLFFENVKRILIFKQGPFFRTASFWKRFVVLLSITLSAAGLILSAIASLNPESEGHQRSNSPSFAMKEHIR